MKLIAEFTNKTWTLSDWSYTYRKSRPQAQWKEGKVEGQSIRWA